MWRSTWFVALLVSTGCGRSSIPGPNPEPHSASAGGLTLNIQKLDPAPVSTASQRACRAEILIAATPAS